MIAVESLTTKFGTCRVNNGGYWVVKGSTKEGNGGKLLHRLIYADYHNIELSGLEWMIIDENKAKQLCEQYNYDIGGLV